MRTATSTLKSPSPGPARMVKRPLTRIAYSLGLNAWLRAARRRWGAWRAGFLDPDIHLGNRSQSHRERLKTRMLTLYQLIPDVDLLLALGPADLAPTLLTLARGSLQPPDGFFPGAVAADERLYGGTGLPPGGYPRQSQAEIEVAVAEGWHWLEINELILPAPGYNGRNGWKVLSRQAATLATDEDFARFKEASAFPKSLLHPTIADKVRLALARGDLDDAVFIAFKAVEVAVREVGGFGPSGSRLGSDAAEDLMQLPIRTSSHG